MKYLLQFFENGGRPSGMICFEDLFNSIQKSNMKNEITKMYKNIGNESNLSILPGKFSWQQVGITPNEINLREILESLSENICISFGIPPVVIGLRDFKFSNFSEVKSFFYTTTILYYSKYIVEKINDFYDLNLKIKGVSDERN